MLSGLGLLDGLVVVIVIMAFITITLSHCWWTAWWAAEESPGLASLGERDARGTGDHHHGGHDGEHDGNDDDEDEEEEFMEAGMTM